MAELLNKERLIKLPSFGIIDNAEILDNIKERGVAYVYNGIVPNSYEGYVYCFTSTVNNGAVQIYFAYNGSDKKYRVFDWSTQKWTNWMQL